MKKAADFNHLGTIYHAQGKWREAIDAYQSAIRLKADYADAYYNLGLAYIKSHNHDAALHAYEALLALSPEHMGALFQTGCLLMLKQQYEKAIPYFQRLLTSHPHHVETWVNLATCYLQIALIKDARAGYLKALALSPEDKQILYNLGVIQAQTGDMEAAINYYLQAIKADPDFYEAHHNVAALYLSLNQKEAALKHFHEALRLQPMSEAIQHHINLLSAKENVYGSPPAYIQSLFDSYADHYDEHLKQSLHYQVPMFFKDILEKEKKKAMDVLDLGCGTGLCGEVIKPLARSLIGVDLSEKMLAVAARKQIYDDLIAADMLAYLQQQRPNSFDLIMAGDTLVYVGDLAPIFESAHRALRSDGLFLFNLEISEDEPFRVGQSGRFGHRKEYVDELAKAHQFIVVSYQKVRLRQQNRQEVMGHMYLLRAT
jgi:predicted TPR repeat methyltransferase